MDENGKTLTGNEVTETSVSVQLYRYPKGGTRDLTNPVGEPITLTSAKNWTYVYQQVDSGYYYFIQELGTGQQYDVIYSANNNPGVENGGLLTMTNKLPFVSCVNSPTSIVWSTAGLPSSVAIFVTLI